MPIRCFDLSVVKMISFTVIEPYGFVAHLVRDGEFLSRATVERMTVSDWNSRFGRQRNGPLACIDDIVNVHAVDRFTGGTGQYQRVVGREQEPGRRRLVQALPYEEKAFAMHTLRPPEGGADMPGIGGGSHQLSVLSSGANTRRMPLIRIWWS